MGGRFGGQYITNDTVDTYTLPWGGVATVRLLPTKLPSDPATPGIRLSPFRHSQDVNDVGDWIRCYHGVRNFGAGPDGNGVSFLINDPTDPTAAPKEESPAYVLYNAIDRAVKAKQEGRGWASLLIGGHNKGAQLSRPKPIYLVNPLIMQHKEQVYNPPKGWGPEAKPQIMIMSDSAGQALMNLANGIREDADPNDTDWSRVSTCGDLVGLGPGQGQYVTFYKSTEGDPRLRRQAVAQGGVQMANFGAAQAGGGGAGSGFATYCAFAEPVFQGQSADFSHLAAQLAAKAIQWDQVLNFPSYEQQAHWIADKFEPDVICYAFQDYPEWIPARVVAANVARTQQAGHMMPVGGFVGGYMPQNQPVVGQPQMAGWGAAPAQATALGGQAYIQNAVANATAMVAAQQPVVGAAVTTAAPVEAVPFIVDALAPDAVAQQLAAQQAAEQQAMLAAQYAATQQAAQLQAQQAAQLEAQQAAASQQAMLAAQYAASQQVAQLQAQQAAAAQQAAMPVGAVAANWGVPPANAAPAPQAGASMAGLAAGGIPVAVTQATVAASNAAQQPGAGFAMPTTMAPTTPPAAAGQQMTRSQIALLAAQQAAQTK